MIDKDHPTLSIRRQKASWNPDHLREVFWDKSPPFVVNPRAVLTHRVRFACTYFYHGKFSHHAVNYWCGNIGRGELTDDPPSSRLLCIACEIRAVAAGEKSSKELTGRHVCIGRIKPVRMCCRQENN